MNAPGKASGRPQAAGGETALRRASCREAGRDSDGAPVVGVDEAQRAPGPQPRGAGGPLQASALDEALTIVLDRISREWAVQL
jgi:hypothetical protein